MKRLTPFAFLTLLALPFSCAKIPEGPQQTGRLLRVTFTVRGRISGGDVNNRYFVLINRVDGPAEAGPVPIVTRPWGNGFAAPSQIGSQGFVGFVLYDAFQGIGGYGVYSLQIPGTTTLLKPDSLGFAAFEGLRLGAPLNYVTPQAGENQLSFQINLDELPLPDKPYIQINILATNAIPQGADDAPFKAWDALGDGTNSEPGSLNSWLTIPIEPSATYTNAQTRLEPDTPDVRDRDLPGTVAREDLDITDWRIELRNPDATPSPSPSPTPTP